MKALSRVLLGIALAAVAFGQGSPVAPGVMQFFTNSGIPNAGGALCSYASGTSTPQPLYAESTLTTPLPTCAPLDSAGRLTAFMSGPPVVYRFVLLTSTSVTLWTVDGISVVSPTGAGGYWSTSGSTLYNNAGSKVCISPTGACTTSLALLNIQGTSSGSALLRVDDAGGSPGLALYASGNGVGSYAGDSSGLRLRDGSGTSQATIASGNFSIQNAAATGATTLNLLAGAGQGSVNLLQAQSSTGTPLGWIDPVGRFVSPLFNSTAINSAIAFQTSNSFFSVDGNGDISSNGVVNAVGAVSATNPSGIAYQVNGTTMVDNLGNATFTTLTCTGTPCGSGGGGGSFPVSDATVLFYNSSTPTKTLQFDLSAITAATNRTAAWPDANITVVGRENAETISGAKTFSAVVTGSAGFAGTIFNSTASGTATAFALSNLNFLLDAKANITTSCTAGCTAGVDGANAIISGYVTAGTWFGLKTTAGTPATTPGAGYSAFTYKGGASGLHVWLYDTVHTAWSDIDLGAVAGGITSVNGQTGAAQTIAGTANEITATTGSNTVTLSTPQAIATTSNVNFGTVTVTGAFQSTVAAGSGIGFQIANSLGAPFGVDGNGDISANGKLNMTGSVTGTNPSGHAYEVAGVQIVDNARNGYFNNITLSGTCTGCGGGGSGVTSATGSSGQVAVNGDFGSTSHTGAITLALPQAITTTSSVTFGNVTTGSNSTAGVLQTWATNSLTAAIQVIRVGTGGSVTPFQVDGFGDVSGGGSANMINGYKSNGINVIDSLGRFIGPGALFGPNGVEASGYNIYSGFTGKTYNVTFTGGISIPGQPTCTSGLTYMGGVVVSCFNMLGSILWFWIGGIAWLAWKKIENVFPRLPANNAGYIQLANAEQIRVGGHFYFTSTSRIAMLKTIILIAFSVAAFAQQPQVHQTAKGANSVNVANVNGDVKVDGAKVSTPTPATPPVLPSSAKLWRLLFEAQQAQVAANDATKAAKEAQEAFQAEQQRMSGLCGSEFVMTQDPNPQSSSYKDVVCVVKVNPIEPPKK